MKFSLQHIKRKCPEVIALSFFFHARGITLEKTTEGLYRTLLFQLLTKCPQLQDVLTSVSLRNDESDLPIWSVGTLKNLLVHAISRLQSGTVVVIIIDALEECSNDFASVTETIRFLNERFVKEAKKGGAVVRTGLSRRHFPALPPGSYVNLDLGEQSEHSEAIKAYIESNLQIGSTISAERIKQLIQSRVSGIFLWVVLVVNIAQELYEQGELPRCIEARITEVPSEVERLLKDIIEGTYLFRTTTPASPILFSRCVEWVLFARRSLDLRELYCAVQLKNPKDGSEEGDMTPASMLKFINHASKGLVERTKGGRRPMQFIHETVRQYLLDRWSSLRKHEVTALNSIAASQRYLRNRCREYYRLYKLSYLRSDGIIKDRYGQMNEDRAPALLRYSVENVRYHAERALEEVLAGPRPSVGQEQMIDDHKGFLYHIPHRMEWIEWHDALARYDSKKFGQSAWFPYIFAVLDYPDLSPWRCSDPLPYRLQAP